MSRSLVRGIAAAAISALMGAACLLLFYGLRPALEMDLEVSPPSQVTGLYLTERDTATGLTFAWTADVLTIRLPGLDRTVPWHFEARARAELLHAVAVHHDARAARTAEAAVLYHANQLDAAAAVRPVKTEAA